MLRNIQLTFDVMPDVKSSAEVREELGKWMQKTREDKGLKQNYVADKMGISPTQLSRIETGRSGTERDTIISWAKTVGVDENEALRRFKPENLLPEESFEISRGVTLVFNTEEFSVKQKVKIVEATRLYTIGLKSSGDDFEPAGEDESGVKRDKNGLPITTFEDIKNGKTSDAQKDTEE